MSWRVAFCQPLTQRVNNAQSSSHYHCTMSLEAPLPRLACNRTNELPARPAVNNGNVTLSGSTGRTARDVTSHNLHNIATSTSHSLVLRLFQQNTSCNSILGNYIHIHCIHTWTGYRPKHVCFPSPSLVSLFVSAFLSLSLTLFFLPPSRSYTQGLCM
jgi:hypothetical protein